MPLPLVRNIVFWRQCRFAEVPWLPLGEAGCGAQRSRLMRVGEQLRFDETAKLSLSAPRPSSAPFGGTCPYPLCPLGTFPPDRGNRPRGEGKGCLRSAAASGIRQPVSTSSLFTLTSYLSRPAPTLRRKMAVFAASGYRSLREILPFSGMIFSVRPRNRLCASSSSSVSGV